MPIQDSRSLMRTTKTATVHKVIDITPGTGHETTQNSSDKLFASARRHRVPLIAGAGICAAALVALLAIPHGTRPAIAAAKAPANPATTTKIAVSTPISRQNIAASRTNPTVPAAPAKPVLVELNLPTAVQQGLVECLWRGNGKDRLLLDARNTSAQPLRIHLSAGQILASTDSTIVLLKDGTLDLAPQGVIHTELPTLATSSANRVIGAEYHLSDGAEPDLDKLLTYAAAHPAIHAAAVQTATLILTENLPLSSFARFNELSAGTNSAVESQDFKADTADILSAFMIVKEIGIERPLAATIDPQLEIEAMIDPDAHGLAVQYYNISDEWAFWKGQLLQGDPSTRHYALYGIARFYPDVALQMLPKWARGETVSPVFRMSAVEALAQTNRPEAIPILRSLERELGSTTDLGKAAHQGANALDAEFAHTGITTDSQPRHQSTIASAGN